jgi:integrase
VHLSGIYHFFAMNDVTLISNKINRFLPNDESSHSSADRPYTTDEIARILEKCDIRSRVIVLLMATGMRIGAISSLKVGDIKFFSEHSLYMVNVYSNSKRDRYYAFITSECAQAIDDYLSLGRDLVR